MDINKISAIARGINLMVLSVVFSDLKNLLVMFIDPLILSESNDQSLEKIFTSLRYNL